MVDQANQTTVFIIRIIPLDGKLAVLIAVDRDDLIRIVVGDVDLDVGDRVATLDTMLMDRDNAPQGVVGIVIHEVARRIHEGGHLRAMAGRVVLVGQRDGGRQRTRSGRAEDLPRVAVDVGDRGEIVGLGDDPAGGISHNFNRVDDVLVGTGISAVRVPRFARQIAGSVIPELPNLPVAIREATETAEVVVVEVSGSAKGVGLAGNKGRAELAADS